MTNTCNTYDEWNKKINNSISISTIEINLSLNETIRFGSDSKEKKEIEKLANRSDSIIKRFNIGVEDLFNLLKSTFPFNFAGAVITLGTTAPSTTSSTTTTAGSLIGTNPPTTTTTAVTTQQQQPTHIHPFFKIWRNIHLRNKILQDMHIYSIHKKRVEFKLDELSSYMYRDYLQSIKIKLSMDDLDHLFDQSTRFIPYGVSDVIVDGGGNEEDEGFGADLICGSNRIPSTVKSMVLHNCSAEFFTANSLPDSITHLEFGKLSLMNQTLSLLWLPPQLKTLVLGYWFQKDIEQGQLPASLTSLVFKDDYVGIIVPGSIPISVTSLKFECKRFNSSDIQVIPIYTTNLSFSSYYKNSIAYGDIPHNVTSLKFNKIFNRNIIINNNSLPNSLISLDLGHMSLLNGFSRLPRNLGHLKVDSFDQVLNQTTLPGSMVSINIKSFNSNGPLGNFSGYQHLEEITLGGFNNIIPDHSFPPSLRILDLSSFTGLFNQNTLQNGLVVLGVGQFHKEQDGANLPDSIRKIRIHEALSIEPDVIPPALEYLEFKSENSDLQMPPNFPGYGLPQTFKSISINMKNKTFINNMDSVFFGNYITMD